MKCPNGGHIVTKSPENCLNKSMTQRRHIEKSFAIMKVFRHICADFFHLIFAAFKRHRLNYLPINQMKKKEKNGKFTQNKIENDIFYAF